jgi:hypothetical protein
MTHHAVLIEAALSTREALLVYGESTSYEVFEFPRRIIGIDEVRELTSEAYRVPLAGTHRLIVVAPTAISFEAQQALLKILEEPPQTTLFLFVVPKEISLLATVRSRFQTLLPSGTVSAELTDEFSTFLAATTPKRLEEIQVRLSKKDQVWVDSIKKGLTKYLALQKQKRDLEIKAETYVLTMLATRGAANKMLLEELAFSLPTL